MSKVVKYTIPFLGLKIGKHEFDFQIQDTFFEAYEYSRVQKGNLFLKVELEKSESMIILDFHFSGTVNALCDHCGEEFDYPMDFSEELIVKFSDSQKEEIDEILILPLSAYQLELEQYIYEYINLALPMRVLHEEDEDGNPSCTLYELEDFDDSNEPNDLVDPRWEALKKLK
ncbi:MAG: DUF177 domain-containing protein [Bacteroidales bacterium]|nr:DUF177 domain-containing protein [Bacteroidales bacterium]